MPVQYNRITHFIPPENFQKLQQEFIEPNPSDYFIHWLFRFRCMECKKSGQEINEIIPRSRSKKSIMDWRNRVVLCRECHSVYHLHGVTVEKMQNMKEHRKEYLVSIGREKYV